jgi:hypothetical protein
LMNRSEKINIKEQSKLNDIPGNILINLLI